MNKQPMTLAFLRRPSATTSLPESEEAFAREVLDGLASLDELPKGPSHQKAGTVERTRHRMYTWLWLIHPEGLSANEYNALASVIHDRGYFPHSALLLALSRCGACSPGLVESALIDIQYTAVLDDLSGEEEWIPLFGGKNWAPKKNSPRGRAWQAALRKMAAR